MNQRFQTKATVLQIGNAEKKQVKASFSEVKKKNEVANQWRRLFL
jgi:hypothetical protein